MFYCSENFGRELGGFYTLFSRPFDLAVHTLSSKINIILTSYLSLCLHHMTVCSGEISKNICLFTPLAGNKE